MKKIYKKIFCIIILCFLVMSIFYAQHGMRRRGHSMRNEGMHDRVLEEYYSDFYVEKLYYTVDQNTIEINIHFSNSIDPESLNEESIQLYGGLEPLSMEFMYNRSGSQVQINVVFDTGLNLTPLDIILADVRNIRDTALEISSFNDVTPTTVHEYTREGTCCMY